MATTVTPIPTEFGQQDIVYKLKANPTPIEYVLPSRNTTAFSLLYFDKELGNRALRYATNQRSPFEDEQDQHSLIKPIIFVNGFLTVPKNNPVLQWFLSIHPLLGRSFEVVNKEKDAQSQLDFEEKQDEARGVLKSLSEVEIENAARILFGKGVSKKTLPEIKIEIRRLINKDPQAFLAIVDNPQVEHDSDVVRFFEEKLLTIKSGNAVHFNTKGSKSKMCTIPKGGNKYDIVAEFLKDIENEDALKTLKLELSEKLASKSE